jgi:hypothetical protein
MGSLGPGLGSACATLASQLATLPTDEGPLV